MPFEAGLLAATFLVLQCHQLPMPIGGEVQVIADAFNGPTPVDVSGTHADLARRDPEAFLRFCREEYQRRDVRDYTCTFKKQELVKNRLTPLQEIAAQCREEPFSVNLLWIKNASAAKRALYVENAWTDRQGRKLAWFRPAGSLIRLIVPKIKQPIHGRRAKADGRRTLDQFGFRRTLDLIIKYVELGRENGVMDLRFVGQGDVQGRPTFVFERLLPFTGEEEPYPDRLLRYHIDLQWLVPTACYSYSDANGRHLLGSYVLTNVKFDVGLSSSDFDPYGPNF